MVYMHGAKLSAPVQGRNGFSGVEQFVRVERVLDRMKLQQLHVVELDAHLIDFFHSNNLFNGDGDTEFEAYFEDIALKLFGTF